MPQIQVTINGRQYSVACEDGEEAHVGRLARYIEQKVAGLVSAVGQVGDARLLLMASLLIADELSEAEEALEQSSHGAGAGESSGSRLAAAEDAAAARTIEQLAGRIEAIAARLEGD
jgi:cell division protein ZapA